MTRRFSLFASLALSVSVFASTPALDISTAHNLKREQETKEQIERLAKQYDLSKYTVTRKIVIERGAINHSAPVMTLNPRFLDNDDLELSAYVHEQAHWLLMEHYKMNMQRLFIDLQHTFPNVEYKQPEGDGEVSTTYYHLVVCMLEWQALENLIGAERARKVIDWKQADHYKGIYKVDVDRREEVEAIMKRYGIKW